MKIAAYNLNSINARIENLTAWLAKAAPDVLDTIAARVRALGIPCQVSY